MLATLQAQDKLNFFVNNKAVAHINIGDEPVTILLKRFINVSKTKNKLSYDIFYIKNRSFWLDLKIALKTIRELVSRRGV